MRGQLGARDMDNEIKDTFAVFGSDLIDIKLLRLMSHVCVPLPTYPAALQFFLPCSLLCVLISFLHYFSPGCPSSQLQSQKFALHTQLRG